MKRVILTAVVCAFLAAPALADFYGGRMDWTRVSNHYQGNGGEFTLYGYGDFPYLSNEHYAEAARNQRGTNDTTSFQTFCIEMHEYLQHPMDIWVSTTDMHGTPGGTHANEGGGSFNDGETWTWGDDLEPTTAYLYSQFATGRLSGYNWSGTGRAASGGTLQKVIWLLEGEIGTLGDSSGGLTLTTAQQTQGKAWITEVQEALRKGWTNDGDVFVLNTYGVGLDNVGGCKVYAQDQLYYVPVPAAGLLAFLGLTAAGLKLRQFA